MNALVSVIVPNYNHAVFLTQRLESVLNQTCQDFELIILDDCSKDNSKEVIERFRNRDNVAHIVYNETNSGSTFKQWKKGIELAKGKYIWLAESDDYCDENFLEVALQSLADKKAEIFVAKSDRVDKDNKYIDSLEWWYQDLDKNRWMKDYTNSSKDEIKNYLSKKCTIPNASAVVFENKKENLTHLNYLTRFKSCGDWLFWLMYLNSSRCIAYSTRTTNYFREHPNTTRLNRVFERNFEVLAIYKWVCRNVFNNRESLRLLSYYFSTHILFHSRKKVVSNIKFVLQSFKYSTFTTLFLIKYYLNVNLRSSFSRCHIGV